jgi:hypothetical protein
MEIAKAIIELISELLVFGAAGFTFSSSLKKNLTSLA